MKARFTDEQIIKLLKEHETGEGAADICRRYGISQGTFYKYKSKYSDMDVSDAKKIKALEIEDAKLKKLLARDHAGCCHASGRQFKKVVTPVAKREAVVHLVDTHQVSQRQDRHWRVRFWKRIVRRFAIDLNELTTLNNAKPSNVLQKKEGGLVIVGSTSCCNVKAFT